MFCVHYHLLTIYLNIISAQFSFFNFMIKFSLAFYSVFLLTFKSVNMYFFLLP